MMTRKDYVAIAAIIRNVIDRTKGFTTKSGAAINYSGLAAAEEVARQLAEHMRNENIRFDREKFLSACGM